MDQFRRVGGELVSHRRPTGRRVLLPAEAELCNAVGLSVDEYWYFLELTEAYNGERAKEYELVPDVRNDPVTVAIINLIVGVALTAVSMLLAPKPRSAPKQKSPPSLQTADQSGSRRFAPQTSFDSVQELATLGAIVPLIFTRKGVRVTSQLLWSQMLSLGTGQQLRAIMMFGSGIEQRPDFAGFAIGDTLLENYTRAKIALYFRRDGGRFIETGDRYPEGTAEILDYTDAFSIFWDRSGQPEPYFSGTRTPSTQTQFGAYNPMPCGNAFKVNYELTLIPEDADDRVKGDTGVKRDKLNRRFPCRAAIISADDTGAVYRIDAGQEDPEDYNPWGLEDVNSSIESIRVNADEACSVGDLYMVGERFAVGESISTTEPWKPSITKDFSLRWSDETPFKGFVEPKQTFDVFLPYENAIFQRAAVAVVSNNRECDATEIGIKSTVWKQINGFPNVNSQPDEDTIRDYESKNGSIALGNINKYIKRLSFFRLLVRPLGQNAEWIDISYGTLFCIRGQTPQPQYNYIRLSHARGQYEFKLAPVPGNAAYRYFTDRDVWLLRPGTTLSYTTYQVTVTFSGVRYRLTPSEQSNSEWILGNPPPDPTGSVVSVSDTQRGSIPTYQDWLFIEERFEEDYDWVRSSGKERASFYWDGSLIASIERSGNPAPVTIGNVQYRAVGNGSNQEDNEDNRFIAWPIARYELRAFNQTPIADQIVNASGGSGSGLQFRVLTYSNGSYDWTIVNGGTGYNSGETVYIPVADVTVSIGTDGYNLVQNSLNPYDAVADFTLYEAERTSHMDGPEHEVVYVSEQLQQAPPQYNLLAIAGIRINSTKEWSSFNSLSAFVKRGTPIQRLIATEFSATNLLPEIAYTLLTDSTIGAGSSIGPDQVDRDRMTLAARFCEANGFTWDGVITERVNLREWIFEQAGYCLLDFTILGGKFSLVPSVPYDSSYQINFAGKPEIKALFTDGNIRNLKVTWLSPEERQLFKATCLWRKDTDNGFPETKVLSVRMADFQGGTDGDPEETFDMSGWCTTFEHAFTFARYALKLRQLVDHGLSFETTPQAAMNLAPGEYFRLVSEVTHTSRFDNGSITADGTIQSVNNLNGSYQILYWMPGTAGVSETTLTAVNGKTSQAFLFGSVFTLKNTTTTNRVYKVETLSYAEDGLVSVTASHVPLTAAGSLAILDWPAGHFVVEAS